MASELPTKIHTVLGNSCSETQPRQVPGPCLAASWSAFVGRFSWLHSRLELESLTASSVYSNHRPARGLQNIVMTVFVAAEPKKSSVPLSPTRGLGEGAERGWMDSRVFRRRSSRARFRGLIQRRGIPLTPGPSPALGRGEPILMPLTASDKGIQVSHRPNGW